MGEEGKEPGDASATGPFPGRTRRARASDCPRGGGSRGEPEVSPGQPGGSPGEAAPGLGLCRGGKARGSRRLRATEEEEAVERAVGEGGGGYDQLCPAPREGKSDKDEGLGGKKPSRLHSCPNFQASWTHSYFKLYHFMEVRPNSILCVESGSAFPACPCTLIHWAPSSPRMGCAKCFCPVLTESLLPLNPSLPRPGLGPLPATNVDLRAATRADEGETRSSGPSQG